MKLPFRRRPEPENPDVAGRDQGEWSYLGDADPPRPGLALLRPAVHWGPRPLVPPRNPGSVQLLGLAEEMRLAKWVQCPDCDGREIVSLENEDPPLGLVMDEFECLSCGKTWEQDGIELPNGNKLQIWRVP